MKEDFLTLKWFILEFAASCSYLYSTSEYKRAASYLILHTHIHTPEPRDNEMGERDNVKTHTHIPSLDSRPHNERNEPIVSHGRGGKEYSILQLHPQIPFASTDDEQGKGI